MSAEIAFVLCFLITGLSMATYKAVECYSDWQRQRLHHEREMARLEAEREGQVLRLTSGEP